MISLALHLLLLLSYYRRDHIFTVVIVSICGAHGRMKMKKEECGDTSPVANNQIFFLGVVFEYFSFL